MPRLRLVKGPGAPREYELEGLGSSPDRSSILLGRDDRVCEIHLSHPCVSRTHARLGVGEQGFTLTDEQSKAGTFVNGLRLKPHAPTVLQHRARIEICGYTFLYHDESAVVCTCAVEEEEGSSLTPESSAITSILDGSSTSWLRRTDAHPRDKLMALMELAQDLRKTVTLAEVLPNVLERLLALFRQADRALVMLCDTGPGRPTTVRVRDRGSKRTSEGGPPGKIIKDVLASVKALVSDQGQVMSAPLTDLEGRALGAIQLDALASDYRFRSEDLDLLTTVAFQISIVLENAILHDAAIRERSLEVELKLAQQIQVELLPNEPPRIENYGFFDYYAPAKFVGGDYFDYLPLEGDRLALVVGDVSGKGVPAALLMVKVASALEASLGTEPDPVQVLNQVNRRFSRRNPDGTFVTMVLAILDLRKHQMAIVNAGHLRPLLRRPDGSIAEIGDAEAGLPLGLAPQQSYAQTRLSFEPGAILVLVSDGITEAQSADRGQYGLERLIAQLKMAAPTAADIGRRIIDDVDRFVGRHPQSDDRCLLCIRRRD